MVICIGPYSSLDALRRFTLNTKITIIDFNSQLFLKFRDLCGLALHTDDFLEIPHNINTKINIYCV